MKYDLNRIAPQEPTNATERIASLRRNGKNVTVTEERPNGDVVVWIERERGFGDFWIVRANGAKLTDWVMY